MAHLTLAPTESPDSRSCRPIIANPSVLPCDSGPGPRSGAVDPRPPANGDGGLKNDELGWLASTCCTARARPPYQAAPAVNAPIGRVRPDPASCDTL